MYFYMFDLEEYASELRGFYFDIYKDLPGEVIRDENILLARIANNEYDYKKLEQFNQDFNIWHDGTCSKKVLKKVFSK